MKYTSLWLLTLNLVLMVSGCVTTPIKAPTNWSGFSETGEASFYADKYQSRRTASGERFDQGASTAAHRDLPFGTRVRVINIDNGRDVVVRINDRGPFIRGRIIDLSHSAFSQIADPRVGLVDVELEVLD